jgi:tetratricopeptide (TPR) repeat protein
VQARALRGLERSEEAFELLQQIERRLDATGRVSPQRLGLYVELAETAASLGQRHVAAAYFARFDQEADQRRTPPESTIMLYEGSARGDFLTGIGRHAEAITQYTSTLEVLQKHASSNHDCLSATLRGRGLALFAAGRRPQAVADLERALELALTGNVPRESLGLTRFALARTLWQAGPSRIRAIGLAKDALVDFESAGTAGKSELEMVKAWLAAHP